MLEGIQIIDYSWRHVYANDAYTRPRKISADTLLGHTISEALPAMKGTGLLAGMTQCMVHRTPQRLQNEFVFSDKSSKWFEHSIEPCEEGIIVVSHDITTQKTAATKLNNFTNFYAFISQVNQSIARTQDQQTLFRDSCRLAIHFGKFKIVWIGIFDKLSETLNCVEEEGIPGSQTSLFTSFDYRYSKPVQAILHHKPYYVCNDVVNEMEASDLKSFALSNGIKSIAIIPVKQLGHIIGCFNLHSSEENCWEDREIALLLELGSDISNALDQIQKKIQHAERERVVLLNEKHFRALIEKSSDMISLANATGELAYISPSVTKVLGYSMAEILTKPDHEFIHPDDIGAFRQKIQEITRLADSSFSNEQRLLHKDGHWVWCEGTVTNLLEQPAIHAIVSNFRDVSEKKAMQQHRDFSRSNLRALINNTTDLMWSVGRDFK